MGSSDYQTSYTVSYDSESHWSVLTQMRGSIWRHVLPYCIVNVILMVVMTVLDRQYGAAVELEISAKGHSFISLVVAFLLVSRVRIALARYNEARTALSVMFRECRDLIQNCCVYSVRDATAAGKEWRSEIAYRTMLLLRTTMSVMDYPVRQEPAWSIPELTGVEKDDIAACYGGVHKNVDDSSTTPVWENTMRVPLRIAYLLRSTIHEQSDRLTLPTPMLTGEENRLLDHVDRYLGAYYVITKFLTTPVPFPLIQMARTFLFLYVFTIPFVMLSDSMEGASDVAHCCTVFLITYGFVGLEFSAIELDNPFGDDPNDFDNGALAAVAYEDVFLIVRDVNGDDWEMSLRDKMKRPKQQQPQQQEQQDAAAATEQTRLLLA